jgi:glycosyltransferase involved in cell wall biosynthesis
MDVSVIIPTYNRQIFLGELLLSLARQSYPAEQFEVIIVDDGSTDGTVEIVKEDFPFSLHYFWQANQGDAAARNFGAQKSRGDVLVFLDDDILVEPDYLTYLAKEHQSSSKRIVVGTEYLWLEDSNPLDSESFVSKIPDTEQTIVEHAFVDVCSNNMSLKREAYLTLGMMQKLDFPDSNIWCDVDFSYRAYQQGFEFYRSNRAICYHRDYTAQSLNSAKKRQQEVAYRAVVLFQKYPGLVSHIPMFRDKTPIAWRQDPPGLIIRKLARRVVSSPPVLRSMEQITNIIEQRHPSATLLNSLQRWVVGGYMFRGYRKGLREYGTMKGYH